MESIKEILSEMVSKGFIKEYLGGLTTDGIEQMTGTILGSVTEAVLKKWNYSEALAKAEKEGSGDNQKQLKEFIKTWESDLNIYSEDELNDMFEKTYHELQKNSENFKEVDKEELCKQYKKFVVEYTKTLLPKVSELEKMLIRKLNSILGEIKTLLHDEVCIQFAETMVSVEALDDKYSCLPNKIDYVGEAYDDMMGNWSDDMGMYAFAFGIKNIGSEQIESISVSDLKVYYTRPAEDYPSLSYSYVHEVISEDDERECEIDIPSNGQGKIYLLLQTKLSKGLNDERYLSGNDEKYENQVDELEADTERFLDNCDEGRLMIQFKMKLQSESKRSREGNVEIFLNKPSAESIEGNYSVQSVNIKYKAEK